MIHRRKFLTGLASLIAAPAVVRASSLMPVKALAPTLTVEQLIALRMADAQRVFNEHMTRCIFDSRYIYADGNTIHVSERFPLLEQA